MKSEIVISGMSGRFPDADNVQELSEKLFDKVDLITDEERRWLSDFYCIPKRMGQLKDISKFDNLFFGIHHKLAKDLDPQARVLLEVTYESIVDAGYDPEELRGKNIGVYIGNCSSDSSSMKYSSFDLEKFDGYGLLGSSQALLANRISYTFDFKGPSYTLDTSCSSGAMALHQALQAIRRGDCDAAVVGACSVLLRPEISLSYHRVKLLSPEGKSKSFDATCDGFARSEAVVSLFIQKSQDARRNYASIVHIKSYTDGFKSKGITSPSAEMQTRLMADTLKECNMDPGKISYLEASAAGVPDGDSAEISAVKEVFCLDRKEPLMIGSIKSNIGHTEPASGICGIIKILVALEKGLVPPNLHFNEPIPELKPLLDETLKVITEPTPFNGQYAAFNSFSYGGLNVHGVLRRNCIASTHEEKKEQEKENEIPQLILFCGRTEASVQSVFDNSTVQEASRDFFALLHKLAYATPKMKPYRGYKLRRDAESIEDIKLVPSERRPLWYVFSGMGSQWPAMAKTLMQLEVFAKSIKRSAEILKPYIPDLEGMVTTQLPTDPSKEDKEDKRTIIPAFVSIAAVQIALVDVLNELNLKPDGIVGHSVGELGCAYADGCFTAEQMLLAAYWRGKATEDSDLIQGAMAAVGMTWSEAQERCPVGIYPACHNGEDSVTISGPRDKVRNFIAELKAESIFAREVDACGYAYHCAYVEPIAEKLQGAMEKVVPDPKQRSSRWISSSFPEDKWNEPEAGMADASYFVHNLVSPVLFCDALRQVPKNAIVVEIGPHHLLQSILKREIGNDAIHVGLMKKNSDNVEHLLSSIGKLYIAGLDPDIEKLYPSVPFPVPRNTPMIAPLIEWDHSQTWKIHKWNWEKMTSEFIYEIEPIPTVQTDYYLIDYIVDGCLIFPPLGYIVLIWKTLAKIKLVEKMDVLSIVFENVKFTGAVQLSVKEKIKFTVSILKTTGAFEISEKGKSVCTGFVSTAADSSTKCITSDVTVDKESLTLSMEDIYKELGVRGYEFGPIFQGVMAANLQGKEGIVKCNENWTVFLDSIFQFSLLSDSRRALLLPTKIQTLTIDPVEHNKIAETALKEHGGIPVKYDDETGELFCGGIYVKRLNTDTQKESPNKQLPLLEEYKFIPNEESEAQTKTCKEYANVCSFLSKRILELSGKKNKQICNTLSALKINDTLVDKYLKSESNDFVLLKCLSNIINPSNNLPLEQNAKENLCKYANVFDSDILSQILLNESTLRTTSDIVLENMASNNLKIVEIAEGSRTLCSKIQEYLSLSAMRDSSYTILHSNAGLLSNNGLPPKAELVSWEKKPSIEYRDVDLFIFNNLKNSIEETKTVLKNVAACLKSEGFVLFLAKTRLIPAEVVLSTVTGILIPSIEESSVETLFKEMKLDVICKKFDSLTSTLYLLRKSGTANYKDSVIHVTSRNYSTTIDEVKAKMVQLQKQQESASQERLWLVSEGTNLSGITGFVNCLRQEPGGSSIRCVFIGRENIAMPEFSLKGPSYKDQVKKDLVMNVFKDGAWGSYRHTRCKDVPTLTAAQNAYLNILTIGDLSSLTWVNSSKENSTVSERCAYNILCHVYYASLNFKDVMIASGKLPLRAFPGSIAYRDSMLGIEFSGRTSDGRRVMGIVPHKAMATTVMANQSLLWDVPEEWSLEQAATVPVAYATAYYALITRGRLQRGEKILIHSGSGDVGQAAISIALNMGCEVYTTVGSDEKKEFLRSKFPQLPEEHISSSRDTSFEQDFVHATESKGVNVVLNSLAGDKLSASLSCLAAHGRFLQIGKYDFANNNNLGMSIFLKNVSFEGISLDKLLDCNNKNHPAREEISQLVKNGITQGVVKPLKTTVYNYDEAEEAFKYQASNQHIGKVVLKIREEEKKRKSIPSPIHISAVLRTTFDPQKSYVIIEGIGEMGLELCQWLIDRGAQNIILTLPSGVTTGYQKLCLHRWKQNSVNVVVSELNAVKQDQTKDILKQANKIGPVGGIFNLALVHRQSLMENQTAQNLSDVCDSMIQITKNLDMISRDSCLKLDRFVCFTSIASGRGLAGQSDYGYASSMIEKICEERIKEGYPALAIQWGPIGNTGTWQNPFTSDNDSRVAPQKTTSCLAVLDKFLQQSQPVVSSFVPRGSN